MPDAPPAAETEPRPLLPPEDSFDEKYNSRLEFPLATVGAVLIHVLIGAVLVYILAVLMKGEDRGSVDVRAMEVGGLDDFGDGSAGSGGVQDPIAIASGDPLKAAENSLADPTKIPEVRENMQKTIRTIDPSGNLPISPANAAAFASLDEKLREKFIIGQRLGAGKHGGSGSDGSKGSGPGGTGADSTLGRNLRWTLRFKVTDGRDYLEQLRAMGAKVVVPIPGGGKSVVIRNLGRPADQVTVSDDDLVEFAGLQKFVDNRRDVVNSLADTLGLRDVRPTTFCAVFPKAVEEELDRKERAYRNRRPEDIEMTAFRVTVRGGEYEVVVDEQKPKR